MSILTLLLVLLVVCAVIWAARALISAFGIPEPVGTVLYVGIVLLAILWLVAQLGGPAYLQL